MSKIKNNSGLPFRQRGMSRIDTGVILGFLAIGVLIFLFSEYTWWILGATVVLLIVLILVSTELEDRARKLQYKADYENGEIKKEFYILQVGEKFYQKHHGKASE